MTHHQTIALCLILLGGIVLAFLAADYELRERRTARRYLDADWTIAGAYPRPYNEARR